ncbi:MAG: V-type ATP synthase subunit B [Candidatus Njordarchaeia archaeon]|nr:V-type ATP synthase subunit B [Candidatus Korarchaeota archaeon]
MSEYHGLFYKTVTEIKGPILVIDNVHGVGYNENVNIVLPDGSKVLGSVLETEANKAVVQVLGDTTGLDLNVSVHFTGETVKIPLSDEVIGRVFSGSFIPRDKKPPIFGEEEREVFFSVINPAARVPPHEFIQTGVSAIDGMNSLVRGQKLPIFSEAGLPHNTLAAQIARQATIIKKGAEAPEDFVVVFCAIGIKKEEYDYFRAEFEETGALNRAVMILNLADDPVIERIIAPRVALTVAEYLAFDLEMHVLTILTDMTNYAEALRIISTAREEIPARKGYPGYLYSDLATIYERAGVVIGKKGSLTQMPILTMPGGDITHPVPDLTGYITEGQLILDRDLFNKGIYPPMDVLRSLSRLMKDGIGKEKTREDHKYVADQLYVSYSEGTRARGLEKIVGREGLSERERRYLRFADDFEHKFVSQGRYENRSIEETLDIAWDILSTLPEDDLIRIEDSIIKKYYRYS